MTTSQAIITTYRNVRFRSRLEARWAAFFDQLLWPWLYEPLDLAGYIPDFILPFTHDPVLVEVKPAIYLSDLEPYQQKITESGWAHEAVIVGATLFQDDPNEAMLGLLGQHFDDPAKLVWGDSAVLMLCEECAETSFCAQDQSWHCRRRGCYTGNTTREAHATPETVAMFQRQWAIAGNLVQWRKENTDD